MSVWEITNSWANDVAGVTHADDIELDAVASAEFWKQFEGFGSPLRWHTKPRLTAIEHAGRKKRPGPRFACTLDQRYCSGRATMAARTGLSSI
jgi:hypothetical protein